MDQDYGAYGEYELGYKSPLFAIEPGLVEMWEDPEWKKVVKKIKKTTQSRHGYFLDEGPSHFNVSAPKDSKTHNSIRVEVDTALQ